MIGRLCAKAVGENAEQTLSEKTSTTLRSFHLDQHRLIDLCHRHTSLSISITPPHSSILKPLLLPYLHLILHPLQALLASLPTRLPMWGRYRDQDALFSNIHSAQAMCDAGANQAILVQYRLRDTLQRFEGKWSVCGVGEVCDSFGLERVARTTYAMRRYLACATSSVTQECLSKKGWQTCE